MKSFIILVFMSLTISGCLAKPEPQPSVDYYGQHYQTCIQKSRSQTAYTHASMQEETLGHAINNCMEEYGWVTEGKELN